MIPWLQLAYRFTASRLIRQRQIPLSEQSRAFHILFSVIQTQHWSRRWGSRKHRKALSGESALWIRQARYSSWNPVGLLQQLRLFRSWWRLLQPMIYLTLQKDDMAKFTQRIQDQKIYVILAMYTNKERWQLRADLGNWLDGDLMYSFILGFITLTFYLAYFIFHLSILFFIYYQLVNFASLQLGALNPVWLWPHISRPIQITWNWYCKTRIIKSSK